MNISIFIVPSIFIIIGAIIQCRHYVKVNKRGFIETIGKVVDHKIIESRDSGRRSITYAPIIEYNVDGIDYEIVSNISTSGKTKLGKEIKVKYNPENPSEAVKSKDYTGFIIMSVGILILVFIITGVFD